MRCIYRCTNVNRFGEGRPYLERANAEGVVEALFPDETVYITLIDDKYFSVTNVYGEVFHIGNNGVDGIDRFLSRIKYNAVIVNGDDYQTYLTNKEKEQSNGQTNEQ